MQHDHVVALARELSLAGFTAVLESRLAGPSTAIRIVRTISGLKRKVG